MCVLKCVQNSDVLLESCCLGLPGLLGDVWDPQIMFTSLALAIKYGACV